MGKIVIDLTDEGGARRVDVDISAGFSPADLLRAAHALVSFVCSAADEEVAAGRLSALSPHLAVVRRAEADIFLAAGGHADGGRPDLAPRGHA